MTYYVPENRTMRMERMVCGLATMLVACGGEKQQDAPAAGAAEPPASIAAAASPPVVMICGADTLSVQGAREDTLQLNVHGEAFTVILTPSASGAKYQTASDSSTFYWSHGTRALVQVRGQAFPECELIPGA